jgi:hypothetical protein
MNDKETFLHLYGLASDHHDKTGDMKPWLVLASAEDNAGDSGFSPDDEGYFPFVIESLHGLLAPRGSDYQDQIPWFAARGFVA